MGILWEIQLLNGLRVIRAATLAAESAASAQAGSTPGSAFGSTPDAVIERFRTQKTGALLAYLAMYPQLHTREVLCEMLWPDAEPAAAAQSLRTSLSSLRRQLEPPGVPAGAVLVSSRTTLQLNSQVVSADARQFQLTCKVARAAPEDSSEKTALLENALALYSGVLLPGFYDDWILSAARELEEEFFSLLQQLIERLENTNKSERALHWARVGLRHDETRIELQEMLARLTGENSIAHAKNTIVPSKKPALKTAVRKPKSERCSDGIIARSTQDRRAPIADPLSQTLPNFNAAPVILPAILDRFFGREGEINHICRELERSNSKPQRTRLLTLTGAGGSGKTRLAIEAAHQFVNARWQSEQAIFYVPLADIRDEKFLLGAILEVLALPRAGQFLTGVAPEAAPFGRLVAALNARPTLLVLDNFEHLAASGAPLLQSLLECVPQLQLLVTSQQRLGVAGGREIAVTGLPFPAGENDLGEGFSLEKLWEFPAVQMFVERAQAAGPDFGITRQNAAAISEICRCLEGVPLALELASARAGTFTPAQIATHLADVQKKFRLLTATKRPATLRHASLYTAMTWSYELLPDSLAKLWTSLSIFRGGFTLEAAQEICEDDSAPHRMGQLRACSLLNVAEARGVLRFRLPELLREYAGEKLREAQDSGANAHAAALGVLPARHARYFAKLLDDCAREFRTEREGDALATALSETENARAAFEWASAHPSVENQTLAASLALSLGTCLQRYGLHREAQAIIESGLKIIAQPVEAKTGKVSFGTAQKNSSSKNLQAELLRESIGLSLDLLEWDKARENAQTLLTMYRKQRKNCDIAGATNLLGLAAKGEGNWAQARAHFSKARALFEREGDAIGLANIHNNLGLVEYLDEAGDKTAAATHLQAALRARRAVGDRRAVAEAHINLGALAQQSGRLSQAQRHYLVALKIEARLEHLFGVGRALCNLGEIAEGQGDYARAVRLYAVTRAVFEEAGVAYQTYTTQRLAALSGEAKVPVDEIHARAHELVRRGVLQELTQWALTKIN